MICMKASPLLMTWNGTGPYNPNIDPITYTEFLELELSRSADDDGDGHAGRVDLEFRRGFRPSLSRIQSR